MADITGGPMVGTNTLQSAIDRLSRSIDKMSTTYSQAKPAVQNVSGAAKSLWTGKASGTVPPNTNSGADEEIEHNGQTYVKKAAQVGGIAATFKALSNYGDKQLQQQLPMDQYVYQGTLGMAGNLTQNQSALRRQAFGQNNQNLNAMAVSPEDAAQMYGQLGQTAGTPMLNQTATGRTIEQSVRAAAVANPYMSGAQAAGVMSNVYSPNTSMAFRRMGLMTPRAMGTGQARSLSQISQGLNQFWGGRAPTMKEINAGFAEGGKVSLSLAAQGLSPDAIQALSNQMRVQNKVASAGGNQQQAQQLIDRASRGDTKAQDELQSKYGVARSDAQSLKNLQASRTGRAADTSSSFNKGISDSTDTLQKFSKAFTDFMEKSGLQDVLGYGGGWASQLSDSVGGMGGLAAGALGIKGGIGALGKIAGGGKNAGGALAGSASGAESAAAAAAGSKFTNTGTFKPYSGVRGAIKGAGVIGTGYTAVESVGHTALTKEGRQGVTSHANQWEKALRKAQGGKDSIGSKALSWLLGSQQEITNYATGGYADKLMGGAANKLRDWFGMNDTDKNQRSNTGDGQAGGDAQKALTWAQAVSKKHMSYQWAGVGNPSYDCSGFMGSIAAVIEGKNPKKRYFSTASFGTGGKHFAPSGWKYHQKAAFMIGVENGGAGGGHTAGTLLGHNVESNGSGGPRVDRNGARGYRNPLFNGDWWGFIPSGKNNGGAADTGSNQSSSETQDTPSTNGGGGLGFGDTYGSSEEVSSLQSLLDTATGASASTPDKTKSDNAPQGSQQSKQGSDLKGANLKNKQQYYAYAKKEMAALGMSVSYNWPSLQKLWEGESNWNPEADNPNSDAYGIPQALPGSKMASEGKDWRHNASTQIRWGLKYIKNRPDYRNPATAYKKWLSRSPHWYGTGTMQAKTLQEMAAKDALEKMKAMPKAAQGPHRILDMNALTQKTKKRNIDLNFKDGAIVLNIKDTSDPNAIKQAAQDFVNEVKKLNVYQAVMG